MTDENAKISEPKITDEGHLNLLKDIKELLYEAESGEFHDFANEKYAMPKVELSNRLHQIRMNVIEGKYDNAPQDENTGKVL